LVNTYASRAKARQSLGDLPAAIDDWQESANRADGALRHICQCALMLALLQDGQTQRACEQAQSLLLTAELGGVDFYNLACVYSQASASEAIEQNTIAGERDRLAEEYARQAISLLERARAAGAFTDPAMAAQLQTDADLAPLHARDDFQSLLASVAK
jgi:tetratricopeptide (TPR) repeat protein